MKTFLMIILLSVAPAWATINFSAQNVSANAGDMQDTFEITMSNNGTDPINVGSFTFEIQTGDADITFTDATNATTTPYIFFGASTFPDLVSNTFTPGQDLIGSDIDSNGTDIEIDPGTTVGLGLVFYNVAASLSNGTSATLVFASAGSSLSQADGTAIPIDEFDSGQITLSQTAVPEPGVAWTAFVGILVLAMIRLRR